MSTRFIAFIFAISSTAFGRLGAESNKYYLAPGSLFMHEQRLFVDIAGELYPVSSVKTDEQGVYVDDWEVKWNCKECGKPNFIWFSFCAWCGKPKEKK